MLARRSLLWLLLLLLTGCGFHLRGEDRLPAAFSPIRIEADELSAAERALLRAELERAGAKVVEQAPDARRLWLRWSSPQRRPMASSSLASVSLWRIEQTLEFGLRDEQDRELVPTRKLNESTSIELDSDNPQAARSRLQQAQWRLRQALLRELVFRLARP